MPLGNFTRASLEQRASDQINTVVQALSNLSTLNSRMNAELAAGTLDSPSFYGGDATNNKANIVGALTESAQIYAWLTGNGTVTAPAGDPLAYGKFLLG